MLPGFNFLLVFWHKATRSLGLALRSLCLHKLRTFLSVLGIIIGTAAVIALMAFGEGSMQDALDDISRQGATNIIIRSVKPPDDGSNQRAFLKEYGLTAKDYDAFQFIGKEEVRPWLVAHVPMRVFHQEIRYLHRMHHGRVVATSQDYLQVSPMDMKLGRFLLDSQDYQAKGDNVSMRNVCVLGSEIAEALFPDENPLGQTLVISRHLYVVVGVLAERRPIGAGGGSQAVEEFDNDVYIPYRTSIGRIGYRVLSNRAGSISFEKVIYHQIILKIDNMDHVEAAGMAVRDWLEDNHLKKDWAVTIPLERLKEAERARDRYKILLFFIASISLLVGGIGIMNIMVATVTERTREIGIRRALGAKRRDITLQFLMEAIVQTTSGGLVGVLLGLAIIYGSPPLAELFQVKLPAKLHVPSIFLALGVAIGVGVVFGLYPARRASRLDPIEALQHT